MKLVILESPYAGDTEKNTAYAKACLKDCLDRGEAPLASHLLYTRSGILNYDAPEERRMSVAAGHAWYRGADACVVYTDRGISRGMQAGVQAAKDYDVPIEYRSLEDWCNP